MITRSGRTRQDIVDAAETLFAENGVDGVSLREINRAAGSRNVTAIQYHFGDRDGLVRAVLAKHRDSVEIARHALLDSYEAGGPHDLRTLVAALVRPLSAKLSDPDGGCEYLRIMAQLVRRADLAIWSAAAGDASDSLNRWRQLAGALLPEVSIRLHRRYMAIRITHMELGLRAEDVGGSKARPRDDRLFVSHLIDIVTAVLDTPASKETVGLLAAKRPQKGAKRA